MTHMIKRPLLSALKLVGSFTVTAGVRWSSATKIFTIIGEMSYDRQGTGASTSLLVCDYQLNEHGFSRLAVNSNGLRNFTLWRVSSWQLRGLRLTKLQSKDIQVETWSKIRVFLVLRLTNPAVPEWMSFQMYRVCEVSHNSSSKSLSNCVLTSARAFYEGSGRDQKLCSNCQ